MSSYTRWTDLDDEALPEAARDIPVDTPPAPSAPARPLTADQVEAFGGPSELVSLLRTKEALEAQLRSFAGEATAPVDARRAQCFPVMVHTKETRIEERRLRRRDEQLAQLNRRAVEQHRVERVRLVNEHENRLRQLEAARVARVAAEQRLHAQRAALEQVQLDRRRELQATLDREQNRQAAERARRAEALLASRLEHQLQEEARREAERRALQERWGIELQAALLRAGRVRQQQAAALERTEELRRLAAARRTAQGRRHRSDTEHALESRQQAAREMRAHQIARTRADQRSFDAERDEGSRAAQARVLEKRKAEARASF